LAQKGQSPPASRRRLLWLTQAALGQAMGVQRKHVNELCNNRRNVTAATALILARVFGNGPDFWLNVRTGHGKLGIVGFGMLLSHLRSLPNG
jgi:addiction module HigA family antidote